MQMATAAVKWAQENGITVLWLAAATPHIPRCMRDLKFAIKRARADIEIDVCPGIGRYSDADWFRKNSHQYRTKSRFWWWMWNTPISLLPMSVYVWVTDKPL
jgi:hypothetical protein